MARPTTRPIQPITVAGPSTAADPSATATDEVDAASTEIIDADEWTPDERTNELNNKERVKGSKTSWFTDIAGRDKSSSHARLYSSSF